MNPSSDLNNQRWARRDFLSRIHAVEFPGSAAASAAVRRALAPNTEAPGRTHQWMDSIRHEWAARARPTAPEAGAIPIPTAWIQLKLSAAATIGLTLCRLPAMVGPFTREDFDHLVPADKKLSPDWVLALENEERP